MRITRFVCLIVITLVILGMSNTVWAATLNRHPIQVLSVNNYNAGWYSEIEGDFDDIYMPEAPNSDGVEIDETGMYGWYSMEMQWHFTGVPTDGDTYYYKFYVDYLGEWFNVYYWYNAGWVYLGTVTSSGYKSFTIATPQSSSPSFAYTDYLTIWDYGASHWEIGWSYITVIS